MLVQGINCIIPSNKIDNKEIIELVTYYSKPVFNGDIKDLQTAIKTSLKNSGIESRYWRKPKERPLDLIYESYIQCLNTSELLPKNIDLLIYVGIDRGFIEPANANFIAKKLGLLNVRTFDIVDACMGWCTATQIAQSLIKNKEVETVLIISSECPMDENGTVFPRNFIINNIGELKWKFPSFTIGEAVSTTILCKSENDWDFMFSSDSSKADLCTIPLYKFFEYSDPSEKIDPKNNFMFSAYGKELYFAGYKKAVDILKNKLSALDKEPKLILPHSVSLRVPNRVGEIFDLKSKIFTTFPKLGNIATSSIPAHIYFAILANKIKKGDYLIGWIASGGLKYSAFDIYV
jgi:acyl-CoA:acyl-CoA alkyltransferase